MLFHSFEFLLFLPAVVFLHFRLPHRFRWILLLGASYWFYAAWRVEYLLLIMVSTLVDYLASLKMGGLPDKASRRPYLLAAVAVNLGLLGFFKYASFASELLRQALGVCCSESMGVARWPVFEILLPVGISFYTFQTIGYSIDVYRGKIQPERHLGLFAVYVAFFPQLVAGPIERARNLLPQFRQPKLFDPGQASAGFLLILWGSFKKLVIADRLAAFVGPVFEYPQLYSRGVVIAAPFAFLYQVYCDFSGYTDIARGSALLMGFRLVENFCRPFTARTMTEFWQRWHISLSSWIRDYVFLPLSRRFQSRLGRLLSVLAVGLLFGIWHGAGMNFIVFGLLMGVLMMLEQASKRPRRQVALKLRATWVKLCRTFSSPPKGESDPFSALAGHIYLLGSLWFCAVFFAPQPVGSALDLIQAALLPRGAEVAFLKPPITLFLGLMLGVSVVLVETGEMLRVRGGVSDPGRSSLRGWRYAAVTYALIIGILLLGRFSSTPYIYFQF